MCYSDTKGGDSLQNLEGNKNKQMARSEKSKDEDKEYAFLKKKLKEQYKRLKGMVTLRLREMGENASLQTELENRVPLFLTDIQHLIIYSQVSS